MSNFLRKSKRAKAISDKKQLKYRTKEFYKILGRLDDVVEIIKHRKIKVNESNIEEVASEIMGRDIDSMEKFLLLGKLGKYEKE